MSDSVIEELRKVHKIDESFYPNISMEIDLPNGLKGEIDNIKGILSENGFTEDMENILRVLEFKKHLLSKYDNKAVWKDTTIEYRKEILSAKEPIGSTAPIEYLLVSGLIGVLLFALYKFTGSFFDETGKIAARRFFGKKEIRKYLTKKRAMTSKEYNFFANQVIVIFQEDGKSLETLRKNLKKTRR